MATYGHGGAAPRSVLDTRTPADPPVSVLTPAQVAGTIGAAVRTLTLLAPEPPARGRNGPDMRAALEAAQAGVSVRICLGGGSFEELTSLGGRLTVSWSPVPLPALTVVDGEHLVASLSGEGYEGGAVLIRRAALAAVVERWALDASHRGDVSVALDERDRTVLELLRAGLTDEQAARRLGVSTRTYRRRVAILLRRLSAKSRFQAGYRLAELGRKRPTADFTEQTHH
ncbi:LuxR C-terminal-related transcriptional regulator [Streptomyces sp. NPDC091287]|uniref:helix-turn-helix transcriptional regulator n=1 Tax=Streptomyces sp. NPDC091287 TaxID=3365988 RepID=UPI003830BD5C